MKKRIIKSDGDFKKIVNSIINAIIEREHFLIVGHKNPDEDCIASMVSIALIISKFSKDVTVYISDNIHDHFQYLLNICSYNSISCFNTDDKIKDSIDTIIICDTAKPSMMDVSPLIKSLLDKRDILKIEFDHHIGADSEYIGDEGYRLVTEATSASELVGIIALELQKRKDLQEKYNITNPLTRNLILAILTGIVGDTKMGKFIKSERERKYYNMFSELYNSLLKRETTKETNFTSMDEVFNEIQSLSSSEQRCFDYFNEKKKLSQSIGYTVIDGNDMDLLLEDFDYDTIINVARSIADVLAEESSKLGLVVYDDTKNSGLIQYKLRRSKGFKSYDLRKILEIFSIENGGGHEGAIAFRFKKNEIENIHLYTEDLILGIEKAIN
ncbi:bifunctional oligoribonuclease/PAP phosphatase NrnA [Spirochaetota bacterium]